MPRQVIHLPCTHMYVNFVKCIIFTWVCRYHSECSSASRGENSDGGSHESSSSQVYDRQNTHAKVLINSTTIIVHICIYIINIHTYNSSYSYNIGAVLWMRSLLLQNLLFLRKHPSIRDFVLI